MLEDYEAACFDLQKMLNIEENTDIRKEYEDLAKFIADQKVGEKKVFKSFFRVKMNTYIYSL